MMISQKSSGTTLIDMTNTFVAVCGGSAIHVSGDPSIEVRGGSFWVLPLRRMSLLERMRMAWSVAKWLSDQAKAQGDAISRHAKANPLSPCAVCGAPVELMEQEAAHFNITCQDHRVFGPCFNLEVALAQRAHTPQAAPGGTGQPTLEANGKEGKEESGSAQAGNPQEGHPQTGGS